MKIKILGTVMLISVLVCGGGVDTGSAVQTIVGLLMFGLSVGGILIEDGKKNHTDNRNRANRNDASYPCFFRG